jgi:hypothetical protein
LMIYWLCFKLDENKSEIKQEKVFSLSCVELSTRIRLTRMPVAGCVPTVAFLAV